MTTTLGKKPSDGAADGAKAPVTGVLGPLPCPVCGKTSPGATVRDGAREWWHFEFCPSGTHTSVCREQ